MSTATETRTISIAHSPDSDDAFMFYGLATNKIDTGELQFTHVLEDIQSLNEKAMREVYDVTAVSFHAYAYIADKYALLPHGASIGDNYGPIVVAREPATIKDLAKLKIAIPGKLTSAFLALRILEPSLNTKSCLSIKSSKRCRRSVAMRDC
jgi:1,4-dihydroxy-6-naphthoate synthase